MKPDTNLSVENYMSRNVVSMSSESNALEVAKMMLERKISSILLTDKTNKIVGILTERDLLREACGKNVSAQAVVASSIMSKPLMTIDKNSSIEDAAKLMVENRVRHIAVEDVQNNKLIGVIATSNLASFLRKHAPKYYEVAPTLFEGLYCE